MQQTIATPAPAPAPAGSSAASAGSSAASAGTFAAFAASAASAGSSAPPATDGIAEVRYIAIPDWPDYVASSHGWIYRVVSTPHVGPWFRCLAAKPDGNGYRKVTLSAVACDPKTTSVHILVALTFLGECPEGMTVDHIDQDKLNNDISNLRYATPREQNLNRTIIWKPNTGSSKRREIRTLDAVTAEFEDWPDMQTAVTALMSSGKAYLSEKNQCYEALKDRLMVVYGRHWSYVAEYSLDDWVLVPETLLPAGRKWPSGWEITRTGKVRSPTGKILGHQSTSGHWKIQITRKGTSAKDVYVKNLVLHTFAPGNDRTKEIYHKNGDYLDNRLENLELLTRSELTTCVYARKPDHGRHRGVVQFDLDGETMIEPFSSIAAANRELEVDSKCRKIGNAIKAGHGKAHGYVWRHAGDAKRLPARPNPIM